VAKSGMTKERAALEATRARLEAALSADTNWQALQQSRAQNSADEGAPPLHDARLELRLLANPLFRAWKHVDDAIEDLRKNQTGAEPSDTPARLIPIPALAGSTAAKQIASLADLSQGIARLIQRGLPDRDVTPALAKAELQTYEFNEQPPPATPPQAIQPRPVAKEARAEPPATEWQPSPEPAGPPVEIAKPAEAKPMRVAPPPTEKPVDVLSLAPTPRRPQREREEERESDEPSLRPAAEPEEATVMFVTREPVAPRASHPERTHAPFGWSPAPAHEQADAENGRNITYAPNDDVEEAEVTILTADAAKEQQETAQRDGNLRRFRRALLGD
jgi:hypothetical protein